MRAPIKMFMMDYARSDPPSPLLTQTRALSRSHLVCFMALSMWDTLRQVAVVLAWWFSCPMLVPPLLVVCGHGHCGWRHSQIVNVKVKSVAHKSGHKGVADCEAIDLAFVSVGGEGARAKAEMRGMCTHRNEGILKFYGQRQTRARQQTEILPERERGRVSKSETKGIPHAIVK